MRFVSCAASLSLLAACGSHNPSSPMADIENQSGGSVPNAPPQVSKGTVEAEGINCSNRKQAADARNDVLGVTMGMPAQEAYERLACANPAFVVEFKPGQGFDLPEIPGGSQPRSLINADAGSENAVVYLVGLPGQEKVYAMTRKIEFGEGAEPPVANLLATVTAKYGAGIEHVTLAGTDYEARIHSVAYSPTGILLGAGNADFTACASENIRANSVQMNSSCGLTIDYEVDPKKENTGLAKALYVTVADQRGAMQAIEAYKAYAGNVVARRKADELNRANQAVQNASGTRMPGL